MFFVVPCLLAQALAGQQPKPDRYILDFRDTVSSTVTVEATVKVAGGRLHIEAYTRTQPGYWRSLVRQITATDSAGRALAIDSVSALEWRIGDEYRGTATLHYLVDYAFARRPFPSGNQKGGLIADGAVYLVTKPLFITPDTGVAPGEREVQLQLPAAWSRVTSWREDSTNVYHALGRRDLAQNTMVLGHFATAHAHLGGFEATAAFVGPIARDSATIGPAFTKVVERYFRLFPRTPPAHYLMTFFYADHDDGEGFASSSTVTFGHRIAGGDGILFNNKIAHEVLHYWIGQRIRGSDFERMSWMSEGFTEYIANRTIYQEGLISRREYLDKLSRHIGAYSYYWYSPLFDGTTLFEGGADKTRNRFGVYDGGAVAALCLDLQVRRATHGAKGIDDVLRLLWDRFAADGRRYDLDDLSAAIVEIGGPTFHDFLARYVTGHELLPYEQALTGVGIRVRSWPLSAETYLSEEPRASRDVARARDTMLFDRRR